MSRPLELNYEDIFLRTPAPIMVLDSDLRFKAANPAYLKMVDKSWEELADRYVFAVFPETDERVDSMKTMFDTTLDGTETSISEIPFRISVDGQITEQWWTVHHVPLQGNNGTDRFIIQYSENVTDQVRLREMRNALMGELQHRIGNLFSIVFAIARQTGRRAKTVPEFLETFDERLMSLIKVNQHLTGKGYSPEDTIRSVFDEQLAIHGADVMNRIKVDGPDYPLSMAQAQSLSMAAHELATNALKYGAIGQENGKLKISWNVVSGGGCIIEWQETGIAQTERSEKSGYGTMLLTTIIPSQLGGSGAREFGDNSFTYRLEMNPT